jgi:hypothetical protein
MIAMVIGLVLMLGVTQIFIASRRPRGCPKARPVPGERALRAGFPAA